MKNFNFFNSSEISSFSDGYDDPDPNFLDICRSLKTSSDTQIQNILLEKPAKRCCRTHYQKLNKHRRCILTFLFACIAHLYSSGDFGFNDLKLNFQT
ncbi:hypothetical protein DWB84_15235 [Saccharophagus sp. K07]|nr:hypothetical protein [Saccharophagus sp. K07]